MKYSATKELCIKALLIALVTAATMVISVPVPAGSGYIHLGDSVIMLIALFFGPHYGLIAAGLGSAFADLFLGYAHWLPFTLVIKSLMGYAIGKLSSYDGEKGNFFTLRNMAAAIMGVGIMLAGYFLATMILTGSFVTGLASIPENMIQGIGGLGFYLVVGSAINRSKIYKYLPMR